jgi:hypothetical protein
MQRVAAKFVPRVLTEDQKANRVNIKNETTVVPQPSYSPDLAPADFFLFPKLKSTLKGRRFDTTDEIQKNSPNELFAIPKEELQKAFQSCQKRWERCVASEGNYFEGDKLE